MMPVREYHLGGFAQGRRMFTDLWHYHRLTLARGRRQRDEICHHPLRIARISDCVCGNICKLPTGGNRLGIIRTDRCVNARLMM